MQAVFRAIAFPNTSMSAEVNSNIVPKVSKTGFEQILGTVQQSNQFETVTEAEASEIVQEADFIAVLGTLVKSVESLIDIPGLEPKLVEILEDGDMVSMQELVLVLGTDAETLKASIQQMASLFANEEAIKQWPVSLQEAVDELLAKSEEGKEFPETVPVAELAAAVQLIASNASQIVKKSDKQAAVMVMKAAQIVQRFTGKQPGEQTAKLLQSALQQAASTLQKEQVQTNSPRQIVMQAVYARYNSAAVNSQPAVQLKVAETPLVKQEIMFTPQGSERAKGETVTIRPILGQEALNPVMHQMMKIEQVVMSVKTDPRPMNMEQFIEKFTQIIGNSSLMKTPNGTKLLIKLYPEQLGTLRIELLQQNGVITAKILSSTQAVKELLEQNAHQLKHAFGQQNVNVEKIEIANQETRQQLFDRNNQQDRQNGQKQQNDQQQANQITEEENGSFADLLTNIEMEG